MNGKTCFIVSSALFALFLAGCAKKTTGPSEHDLASAQKIVDKATDTLREHLTSEHKASVGELIARARGIMIIPGMGDVSFFFSLGGGSALVMARSDNGWSGPVFLYRGTGGFGIQAGVTRTSGMILYMDEEDVRYVLKTGAVLQAQAAITFLDADYEGNRTPEFYETGEVVFIGDTSGLYAGIGLEGGGFSDRVDLNAAYNGVKNGDPIGILYSLGSRPEGARHLRDLLDMAVRESEKAQKKDDTEVPSR